MTLVAGFFVRGRFSPEVEGTESGLRTKIINWLKARTNQAEAKRLKESHLFLNPEDLHSTLKRFCGKFHLLSYFMRHFNSAMEIAKPY